MTKQNTLCGLTSWYVLNLYAASTKPQGTVSQTTVMLMVKNTTVDLQACLAPLSSPGHHYFALSCSTCSTILRTFPNGDKSHRRDSRTHLVYRDTRSTY